MGNWWENWTLELLFVLDAVGCTADWMVVSVVVKERTEGAGEEKVLSAPRPAPAVPVVASPEDGACEPAASEWALSDIVAAVDLVPIVGGGKPSSDRRTEFEFLGLLPVCTVGTVEKEG